MDSENLRKNRIFADFSIEALLRKDCSNAEIKSRGSVQQSNLFYVSSEKVDKHCSNDVVQPENDEELISASDDCEIKLRDNENSEDSSSASTFAWLTCTRFKPPKLPRPRRKSTSRRNRGPRIPFSTHHLAVLESTFENSQYLSTDAITRLAENLHLTEARVKIWFQNRRARFRREKESNFLITDCGNPSSSFSYNPPEERTTEGFPSSSNHHSTSLSLSSSKSTNKQSFRHLINDLHLMAAGVATKVSSSNLLYNLDDYRMSSSQKRDKCD